MTPQKTTKNFMTPKKSIKNFVTPTIRPSPLGQVLMNSTYISLRVSLGANGSLFAIALSSSVAPLLVPVSDTKFESTRFLAITLAGV